MAEAAPEGRLRYSFYSLVDELSLLSAFTEQRSREVGKFKTALRETVEPGVFRKSFRLNRLRNHSELRFQQRWIARAHDISKTHRIGH